MLTALAFAHFSSELLLKEQMIIPGHISAKLIDFSKICQKNPAKSAVFYWLFLSEVSPRNFPWNRPIFLRICPWKSFEIWLFSCENPTKSANFSTNLPLKIPWNFAFFPAKYQKPCLAQVLLCHTNFHVQGEANHKQEPFPEGDNFTALYSVLSAGCELRWATNWSFLCSFIKAFEGSPLVLCDQCNGSQTTIQLDEEESNNMVLIFDNDFVDGEYVVSIASFVFVKSA